jgi:hypothetical protein
MPDPEHRRALWERCLPAVLARDDDVDLGFCAQRFTLSGGNIRSIAVTAAYAAAESGRALGMVDVVRSVHREYRKLGRLCTKGEFGEWLDALG